MATFLMFGEYSAESLKTISGKHTKDAVKLIKKYGGGSEGDVTVDEFDRRLAKG